jgi:hypothetical protein
MKNFGVLIISTLLLSVVSCGGDSDHKAAPQAEQNPVCSTLNCQSTVDWKIFLQGRSFPNKALVEINGEAVVNDCFGKLKYSIDRATAPQSITLDHYKVPTATSVKIVVTDMGENCDSASTFFSDDSVDFEVVKDTEIVINI